MPTTQPPTAQVPSRRAILLVDHGSRRPAANAMLRCVADLVGYLAGEQVVVRYAHLELATPTIADGVEACLAAGASELIVQPYMLAPGRHASEDIPRLVADAVPGEARVAVRMAPPLGVHPKLAEVVLERCEVTATPGALAQLADASDPCAQHPDDCRAPWCSAAPERH